MNPTGPGSPPLPAIVFAVAEHERSQVGLELRRRYASDYDIVGCSTTAEVLDVLRRLHRSAQPVAIVLADQALPDCRGDEFFAAVARLHPDAKRGLLVDWGAWGDAEVAASIRQLVGKGRIQYYVLKPWRARDEYFHRTITEFLLDWERAASTAPREVTLVGDPHTRRVHELASLLVRNGVPYASHAADSPTGRALLGDVGAPADIGVPVVVVRGGRVLIDPTNAELVAAYGVRTELAGPTEVDVLIVGSGPAGLGAAVYAASEGLRTLVVERESIGGQAASSSLIRNYLGFSRGISGADLAQRAYQQAWVFGAGFLLAQDVVGLRPAHGAYSVELSGGDTVTAQAVVLATGVTYHRLDLPSVEALAGAGVFYGASVSEARAMEGEDVFVVGGGNSAGQAALHLSRFARSVTILVRGETLAQSMSSYLLDEIAATHNIAVRFHVEVVQGHGDGWLEGLTLRDRSTGELDAVAAGGLFLLIGAHPRTSWLPPQIARDDWGFVLTGADVASIPTAPAWPLERPRFPLETSMPRVFAVGDVRSRSIKRVASAVGEGSGVIAQVHAALATSSPPHLPGNE